MTHDDQKRRVVIALTDSSPVPRLWRAAMQRLSKDPADLVALFLEDERWRRAASLPFTQEISRIGGASLNFTPQRAQEIGQETARQAKRRIDELAAESKLRVAFEVLSEHDHPRLVGIVGGQQSVLIAPALITVRPVYVHLVAIGCQIELVEEDGTNSGDAQVG